MSLDDLIARAFGGPLLPEPPAADLKGRDAELHAYEACRDAEDRTRDPASVALQAIALHDTHPD